MDGLMTNSDETCLGINNYWSAFPFPLLLSGGYTQILRVYVCMYLYLYMYIYLIHFQLAFISSFVSLSHKKRIDGNMVYGVSKLYNTLFIIFLSNRWMKQWEVDIDFAFKDGVSVASFKTTGNTIRWDFNAFWNFVLQKKTVRLKATIFFNFSVKVWRTLPNLEKMLRLLFTWFQTAKNHAISTVWLKYSRHLQLVKCWDVIIIRILSTGDEIFGLWEKMWVMSFSSLFSNSGLPKISTFTGSWPVRLAEVALVCKAPSPDPPNLHIHRETPWKQEPAKIPHKCLVAP